MDFISFLISIFASFTFWEYAYYIFWLHRNVRLIGNTYAHWTYSSKPKAEKPIFSSSDVTVIVPTIESNAEELRIPLQSILACEPHELMLVTTTDKYAMLLELALSFEDSRIKVYQSRIANKRLQLREAIPRVSSDITILVDDDVTWPKTALSWILAPFEDSRIGSVGVCQKVRRLESGSVLEHMFNWLGSDYIERRNFEISATHGIDGGTSCMSGRTNALRTCILKDHKFLEGFCNERWGKYHLNADDDNFVTRWLVNEKWSTWIQYEDECMIETTLENSPKFIRQCLRWARSNWRSNWTTLAIDRNVWTQQRWSTYAIYLATFTSLGLVTDPLNFYLFHKASQPWAPQNRYYGWCFVWAWYIFSKIVKRMGLLRRRPADIIYIPVSIIFGLFHGFLKMYALLTWNVTSWGSRPDGDTNDDERMTPQVLPSEVMRTPSAEKKGLVRYQDEASSSDSESERASTPPPTYDDREPPVYTEKQQTENGEQRFEASTEQALL